VLAQTAPTAGMTLRVATYHAAHAAVRVSSSATIPSATITPVTDGLDLEFDGELLVPRLNLVAYRQIYALEGWLRRICLTAWMSRYGDSWLNEMQPGLRSALETRAERNRRRLYLGAESHSDLLWETTHSEILRLMVAEKVVDGMRDLTGAEPAFLHAKLDGIRDIRNLLAHNRALSRKTHIILAGLLACLEDAVDTFKRNVLYGPSDILGGDDGGLGSHLDNLLEDNDWSRFQAFVALRGNFVEYVSLPVDRDGSWPDAKCLLLTFNDYLNGIVAFCLNKTGDEFIILTPRTMADEFHYSLAETFSRNPNVWTDTGFEEQPPQFVCSPKIWFYENEVPV